ncbi:MAG: cupin domain-containing protein [Gammaproteobacteria bacterium]|nr:cupin domain-containing protein [Gammaproteobacteria bacterium]
MTDILIKRFFELDAQGKPSPDGQQYLPAGESMGVTSLGMNITKLPPHRLEPCNRGKHTNQQEEVYIVLDGHGVIQADGYNWQIGPGMLIRVGPGQERKFVSGTKGLTILTMSAIQGNNSTDLSYQTSAL